MRINDSAPCLSFVVEEITSGRAVLETWSARRVCLVNTEKYRVWRADKWLREFNRRVANGNDK